MVKRRYLMVLSAAIVSVLLGSMFYNGITQAQKGKKSTEVEVINLPLDEEGNLKVTLPSELEVTNLPLDEQGNLKVALSSAKSEYEVLHLGRFNITSGKATYYSIPDWNNPVFAGGYNQLGFCYDIWDMSPGNYDLKLFVAGISWFIAQTFTLEHVNLANTTITRSESSWSMYTPPPALIEIKAPHFSLEFRTDTDAPDWWNIWVAIDVYVYLRN